MKITTGPRAQLSTDELRDLAALASEAAIDAGNAVVEVEPENEEEAVRCSVLAWQAQHLHDRAALYAAAPAMLEALRDIIDSEDGLDSPDCALFVRGIERAREAIAKAEGGAR